MPKNPPKSKDKETKGAATQGLLPLVRERTSDDDDDYNQPLLHLLTPDRKKIKTGVPLSLTTIAGGKYTVYIVNEPCKEDSIVLCHAENVDGDAPYQKGIKDQVANNPMWMRDEFGVIALPDRRDTIHPDSNVAMPQSREGTGKQYSFMAIMLARDPDKSVDEILKEFSAKYQNLMNESDDWMGKNNKVVYVPSTLHPQPVRHWLLDKDMLRVMKLIYGHDGSTTKKDLMHSPEVLLKFFATVEEGREYLRPLSEEQWQSVRV